MQPSKSDPAIQAGMVASVRADHRRHLQMPARYSIAWRPLLLRVLFLCALILLSCMLSVPASAHTSGGGNGSIKGQLLDGSKHNAPLPEQTITLQMAQGPNASDLTTATTDSHGTFT